MHTTKIINLIMTHILPWEKQQKIIVRLKDNGYIIKQTKDNFLPNFLQLQSYCRLFHKNCS